MKTGRIYDTIAAECLRKWYPEMSIGNRNKIIQRGDFDEIEAKIGAKSSIDAAIEALKGTPGFCFYMQDAAIETIRRAVYWSQTPESDLGKVVGRLGNWYRNSTECRAQLALHLIRAVHNRWILDNKSKFFDEARQDRQFMFLPVEFIGFEEAEKDFIFIHPILQALGLYNAAEHDRFTKKLQAHYQDTQMLICKLQDIWNPEGLVRFIRQQYDLNMDIAHALQDETTAERIAEQVIERNSTFRTTPFFE